MKIVKRLSEQIKRADMQRCQSIHQIKSSGEYEA